MKNNRGSRQDIATGDRDRKMRLTAHNASAQQLLLILNKYLRNEITGRQLYKQVVRALESNPAFRNEYIDEYVELEEYAANEMSTRGKQRSLEHPEFAAFVEGFAAIVMDRH